MCSEGMWNVMCVCVCVCVCLCVCVCVCVEDRIVSYTGCTMCHAVHIRCVLYLVAVCSFLAALDLAVTLMGVREVAQVEAVPRFLYGEKGR